MKPFPKPYSVFTVSRHTILHNWFSRQTNILRISFALPQEGEKREPKSGGKLPERESYLSLFSLATAMETVENRRRFPHRSHSHAHPLLLLRLSPCRREHIYHKKRMSEGIPSDIRFIFLLSWYDYLCIGAFLGISIYCTTTVPFSRAALWNSVEFYFP